MLPLNSATTPLLSTNAVSLSTETVAFKEVAKSPFGI
jgi:hypothetical protein